MSDDESLPLVKGPIGPQHIPTDGTSLNDLNFCKTLLAIMVGWNDGTPVVFSQADFDAIAGMHLLEGFTADGQFVIGLRRKIQLSMHEMDIQQVYQGYIFINVVVDTATQCWNWQGSHTKDGYGKCKYGLLHRLSFTHFKGPIPEGELVRHTCHNKSCCNPVHLLSGTYVDNANDRVRLRQSQGVTLRNKSSPKRKAAL